MYAIELLTNFISQVSGIPYEKFASIRTDGSVDVQEKIKNLLDKRIVLVGQDRFNPYQIDTWLVSQPTQHPVLLLEERMLRPSNYYNFEKLKTITYFNETITAIQLMLINKSYYEFDISNGSKWMLLGRTPRRHRVYINDTWTPKFQHNLIYSFGTDTFFGDYNFLKHRLQTQLMCANNLQSLQTLYNSACGSIVSETMDLEFGLTEKTFQPIMALHPILMIAPPGAVKFLRNHGFDMFDDLLDHSYDNIDNVNERIDCLFTANHDVISKGLDRTQISNRLINNQKHLFDFYQTVMKNFAVEIKNFYN